MVMKSDNSYHWGIPIIVGILAIIYFIGVLVFVEKYVKA